MKIFQVKFTKFAQKEYQWFLDNDKRLAERIVKLVESIEKNPFKGFGKPEPLKHHLTGLWSRRIDGKNRLVYEVVNDQTILIHGCKDHYGKK
jgi:toxin YoeB